MRIYLLEFPEGSPSSETIEKQIKEMFPDARICEASDSGIIVMPENSRMALPTGSISRRIRVQTFGHFEVFVDGRQLHFEREKAKELFAYLVDRHGASVTTRQIAAVLWEDAEYDVKLKNRVTRIVASLRKSLNKAGAGALLVKNWNHLAIDPEAFSCDAYEFEKGLADHFRGEYMTNYSWAEVTTGTYVQMQQERRENNKAV